MSGEEPSASHFGPAPDRDEILRLVRLYTDGFGAHRPEMFQEAFHPTARIYWTDPDGAFDQVLILNPEDQSCGWSELDGAHVTGRIISLIQAGEVACVVLGFDNNNDPADSWVDIHTLLRVNGTWKIMAKTATHASRADWAGLGASS